MVTLPRGGFQMGGINEDKFVSAVELPRHHVSVTKSVAMGKAPVTRNEWREVMGSMPPACCATLDDDCPVVGVSFPEVVTYLRKLSDASAAVYRLPSESEWEYACRAGSSTVFPHGPTLGRRDANFLYSEKGEAIGAGKLTPPGRFPANGFGIFDMIGNVCEWTADIWHSDYSGAPTDCSAWLSGGKSGCRTIRGGAWDHLPRVLRASWRDWAPEHARWDNLGFRIAQDI